MTEIVIQSDIPIPGRVVNTGGPRDDKYPIRKLEVGQSFMVPIGAPSLANHARRVSKGTELKFIVRDEVNDIGLKIGSRIWRKA